MTSYSTEDERAALWRAETQARVAFQTYLWTVVLAAPPGPRQTVLDAWSPVLLAQLEAQAGTIDPKDDP